MIPWDEDADVTMVHDDWIKLRDSFASKRNASDKLPLPDGQACSAVLIDMMSFGSTTAAHAGFEGVTGIPGRLVHECTGNYIDVFTARQDPANVKANQTQKDWYWLSEHKYGPYGGGYWGWSPKTIFPIKSCSLEGVPLFCPADPKKYLGKEYGHIGVPDHKWSEAQGDYLRINTQTGAFIMAPDGQHNTKLREQHHLQQLAGKQPPSFIVLFVGLAVLGGAGVLWTGIMHRGRTLHPSSYARVPS
jgi:hypothetical protein